MNKIRVNIMLRDEYVVRGIIEVPDDYNDDDKDKLTWEWVENVADVWWEDLN